jgi:hypothetical protein
MLFARHNHCELFPTMSKRHWAWLQGTIRLRTMIKEDDAKVQRLVPHNAKGTSIMSQRIYKKLYLGSITCYARHKMNYHLNIVTLAENYLTHSCSRYSTRVVKQSDFFQKQTPGFTSTGGIRTSAATSSPSRLGTRGDIYTHMGLRTKP